MKCISIFVICVTLQSTLVFSRTVNNVLLDFQPVFDEIHSEISNLQGLAHGQGSNQTGDIQRTIVQFAWLTQKFLVNAKNDITDQVRTIMDETGMVGYEDLTEHCFAKKDESIISLSGDNNAGSYVCSQLSINALDKFNNILIKYYTEQNTWHTNLEYVKERCNDKTTPLDMQTCLIEHLYLLVKPYIKEMRGKMDTFIESNEQYVEIVRSDIKTCFSIVYKKTQNDILPIISDFKKCVVEAAENKP